VSPDLPIPIEFAAEFEQQIRSLAKRYRQIRSDLQAVITQLEAGERPGDLLTGLNVTAFKLRVKNSDIQKGKSAGYRIIYQVEPARVILLTIYSKSDRTTIAAQEIEQIVEAVKRQTQEE
jgi:mRNA-degrading endonuclease RelE of RelBE toxin-antitoxin system